MDDSQTVEKMRQAIRKAFLGGDQCCPFGLRHAIRAICIHLLDYLRAIDPETVGATDVLYRVMEDRRLADSEDIVEACRKDLHALIPSPRLRRDDVSLPHQPGGDSILDERHVQQLRASFAPLLMIPEVFDTLNYSIRRAFRGIQQLLDEIEGVKSIPEMRRCGLSAFALTELRELCSRLETITIFCGYVLDGTKDDFPLHERIQSLSGQLNEFARLAIQRHTDRLLRHQCRLHHDSPYRTIIDSMVRLARRMAEIAEYWAEAQRTTERPAAG